jgi:hypothetical protein
VRSHWNCVGEIVFRSKRSLVMGCRKSWIAAFRPFELALVGAQTIVGRAHLWRDEAA